MSRSKVRPENVIQEKRGKHSEKPDDVYRIIEKAYPTLKEIELFAKRDREEWKRWGNGKG
ncbi:MT-A70 family methyltransferase [Chitinispirillales bacterium ANBcel5]|uniref:MT-A70 family methyltransferase n=1 Tax=Cellulosispirillum alkaliphilum TaxID=3039283 RepID=UPI002A577197|nr:MT-A70 family methyltransferase [Chitinispirillales bacterium ANBcel5]